MRHRDAVDYLVRNSHFKFSNAEIIPNKPGEQQQLEASSIKEGVENSNANALVSAQEENKEELKKLVEKLTRGKIFERIYSIIFGSQINILSKLIANNGSLLLEQTNSIYNDTISKNPSI